MRIILLRHGRTEANELRLYCGSSDPPLSAGGREALMRIRARRGMDAAGLMRITSGMRRTDETMRLLFDAAPDRIEPDLREIDFGEFEMLDYDRLKTAAAYREWIADDTGELSPPGGESANAFRHRVVAAADRLAEDALIVTHGGVIAALMEYWFPGEGKNRWDWQPDFGCGYAVCLDGSNRSYEAIE